MKKFLLISSAVTIFLLPVAAQIPGYVPASGLVGWWPFNGNANDESGNGNNGNVSGASLSTDRFNVPNKAYNFNGSNNYISSNASNLPLNNSDLSISAWFNISSYPSVSSIGVVSWGQWLTNQARYMGFRQGYNNKLTYAQYYNDIDCNFAYNLNTWYHYVITCSSSLVKFYINGNLVGSFTRPTANTSNGALLFGTSPGNGDFFPGSLDDIGVWNRALSSCEVEQLYNCLNITATSTTLCVGQSATLTASGPPGYVWVPTSNSSSVNVVTPSGNPTYSLISTTASGCVLVASLTMTVYLPPQIATLSTPSMICLGGSATLSASGAINCTWQPVGSTGSVVVVTPSVATVYNVIGQNNFGCTSSSAFLLDVSSCTGLLQYAPEEVLRIFPNPNNGFFTISASGSGKLILSDLYGKLVKTQILEANTKQQMRWDDLPDAVYIISGYVDAHLLNMKLVIAR